MRYTFNFDLQNYKKYPRKMGNVPIWKSTRTFTRKYRYSSQKVHVLLTESSRTFN